MSNAKSGNGITGKVQGVSLDSFLQMVQMEHTTCTLKVTAEKKVGALFIRNGELIDAQTKTHRGRDAAVDIIGWQDSVIQIAHRCDRTENRVQTPLMTLLLEGLKLRDEKPPGDEPDTLTLEMEVSPDATPPPEETRPSEPRMTEGDAPAPPKDGADTPAIPEEKTTPPALEDFSPMVINLPDADMEPPGSGVAPAPKAVTPPSAASKSSKSKQNSMRALASILVLLVVGAGGYWGWHYATHARHAYENLQNRIETMPEIDARIKAVETYLKTAGDPKYRNLAEEELADLHHRQESEAYRALQKQEGDFDAAIQACRTFLEKFPKTPHKKEVEKRIAELTIQNADAHLARLSALPQTTPLDQRIALYIAFRNRFAHSPQAETVDKWIANLADPYAAFVKRRIATAVKNENWQDCVTLGTQFRTLYADHPLSKELARLMPVFQKNRHDQTDYVNLMTAVDKKGSDIAAARKLLADYLRMNPEVYTRKRIQAKIDAYDQRIRAAHLGDAARLATQRLQGFGRRFDVHGNGTFTDKDHHRMWALLDSNADIGNCMDYTAAKAYVKGLRTGGYKDWRLPTPRELVGLFSGKQAFPLPADSTTRYWTDKAYRRYVQGWTSDVTVVPAGDPSNDGLPKEDARACESVWATRP